jgi:hypothetical protein
MKTRKHINITYSNVVSGCVVGVKPDKKKKVICPKCKCVKIIPIFYGTEPTQEALCKESRGEIKIERVMAGSRKKYQRNYCKGCGHSFGKEFLDLPYLREEEEKKWEKLESSKSTADLEIERIEMRIRLTEDEEKRDALVKELAEYKKTRIEYLEQSLNLKHVKDDPSWVRYLEKKIAELKEGLL